MTLHNPIGLVGLVMVPILILIYLLKKRTHEKTVSSTFMWKQTLKYMKRKFPFNFPLSFLLVLQILTVVIVSLILADPYVPAWETGETIVVVDGSASMMTEVDGVSRFDRVKREVHELSLGVDQNHRVTVIFAGEEAEQVIFRSDQQLEITGCLDDYTCAWGDADLLGALKMAQEAQMENTDAKILLFTDRKYNKADGIEVRDMTQEEWNISVLGLDDVSTTQGLCQFQGSVVCYGKDVEVTFALYVDGEYADAQKVALQNGVPTAVNFRDANISMYEEAEIRVDNTGLTQIDHFSADNQFFLYPEVERRIHIQLYQDSTVVNRFLGYALSSNNMVTLHTVTNESAVKYSGYDIYVFDGMVPAQMPKDGAVWFINCPTLPDDVPFYYGATVTAGEDEKKYLREGVNTGTEDYEILARSIKLKDEEVRVMEYTPIESTVPHEAVLTCDGKAVVAAASVDRLPIIVYAIGASNLQPTMNYPLLVQNMIRYSAPELFKGVSFQVGESTSVRAPIEAKGITVLHNGVKLDMLDPDPTTVTFDEPGRYEIAYTDEDGETIRSFFCYVSLSEGETNIYGTADAIGAFALPEGLVTSYEPVQIWQYLVLLLALVSLIEWGVYHRE